MQWLQALIWALWFEAPFFFVWDSIRLLHKANELYNSWARSIIYRLSVEYSCWTSFPPHFEKTLTMLTIREYYQQRVIANTRQPKMANSVLMTKKHGFLKKRKKKKTFQIKTKILLNFDFEKDFFTWILETKKTKTNRVFVLIKMWRHRNVARWNDAWVLIMLIIITWHTHKRRTQVLRFSWQHSANTRNFRMIYKEKRESVTLKIYVGRKSLVRYVIDFF